MKKETKWVENWEKEFDNSKMVNALYQHIEAGEAEQIHVDLRNFISSLLAYETKRAREESFQEIKTLMDAWYIVPSDKEIGFGKVYKRVRERLVALKKSLEKEERV